MIVETPRWRPLGDIGANPDSFLVIFVATLVWRFPYEEAIADRIARLEARTGVQVDYTPESASVLGVEWKDVRVTTRTGLKVQFDQAKLRPSFSGMSAYATQGKSQGRRSRPDR